MLWVGLRNGGLSYVEDDSRLRAEVYRLGSMAKQLQGRWLQLGDDTVPLVPGTILCEPRPTKADIEGR